MYNANIPSGSELPSTAKLVKSTMLAAIIACMLLITVVMPAEYGIDPTGAGESLGLKKMGEIKVALAREAMASVAESKPSIPQAVSSPAQAPAAVEQSVAKRSDEMRTTLAPNEGAEIKVALAKGKKVEYSWSSDGGRANFDVHGDSKELNIKYHGYGKGSEQKSEGVIVAAFDGEHGWFWRNRTSGTITVILKTSGDYTDIKRMK